MGGSLEGRVLDGRYRLDRLLGRGSMGSVYRGTRLADARPVAVKVLPPRLAADPELVQRFHAEIESTQRIRHPNVVELLDHGADELLYLVMDLLVGRPLAAVVATEAPLAPLRVAELGRQIAAGLGAAHAVGVVHRDLKPENVLIRRDEHGRDHVTVLDFGLSFPSSNDPGQARITAMDLRIGTPAFMAPEYIRHGRFDARSDLYALGVMLYEACSGRLPFEGPSYKQMHQHLNAVPPPLQDRCAAPPWLVDAIHQLLEKDPEARPASAEAVVRSLQPPGAA